MSLKGPISSNVSWDKYFQTRPTITHKYQFCWGEVIDLISVVRILGRPEVQRSAVRTLTRLLLSPGFQDDVAPVGGVMVWYEWDVEGPDKRRRPEREQNGVSLRIKENEQ